jgi:NADH dehydrogenase
LEAAKGLKKADVQVTLIDRNNYHLFQPLLYQVATAGLSAGDIAEPVRSILKRQKNAEVLMAEVTGLDLSARRVLLKDRSVTYDYLILATGARYQYFGHDDWEKTSPGLKTVEDALAIRRKILSAFEEAEMEPDPEKRKSLLNFVIVGGGPTGVELAGAIAELAHKALAQDFRRMDPASARILLIEAGPRILSAFPEDLSEKAEGALKHLGVTVKKHSPVERITNEGVFLPGEFIPSKTVLWAAGVVVSPLIQSLGGPSDSMGRVKVDSDLSLPDHSEVFVVGDAAHVVQDEKILPGIAPVAMQEGRYVARVIERRARAGLTPTPTRPFHYFDKGQLATVGRSFAVAEFGKWKISGFVAWLMWLFIHIFFLIGLQNRILVFVQWAWAYFTFERGSRVIISEDEKK